jgi:hypothetical protein
MPLKVLGRHASRLARATGQAAIVAHKHVRRQATRVGGHVSHAGNTASKIMGGRRLLMRV